MSSLYIVEPIYFPDRSSLGCYSCSGVAAVIVLPLCLLRNIDSLASMSACSIGFYMVLVLVVRLGLCLISDVNLIQASSRV